MDKQNRDLDALLADVSFRKWVLEPTNESEQFWKNWLIQNPDKSVEFEYAKLLIGSMWFKESEITELEKAELLKRIKATNVLYDKNKGKEAVVKPIYSDTTYRKTRKGNKNITWYLLRYAAILGGAIILAFSADLIFGDVDGKSGIQLVKKVNKQGQKSTIFLPDGSVVSLNSSSSIIYPEEFSEGVREVKINGEAFFEVVMDRKKPFIVKLNDMEAEVLGTSFNARSFKNNSSSISLVTGKVQVSTPGDSINLILSPGEKATLSDTKTLQKSRFSYDEDILWKDGVLYFDKTPIREAIKRMEQWYGVKFTSVEWPEGYEVTGRFNNESLEGVLRSISFTLRFDYKIQGNKVDIHL